MTEKYVHFELHACRKWREPEDLLQAVAALAQSSRLIPLENTMVPVGEKRRANPVATDLRSWFQNNYHHKDTWDSKDFDRFKPKERIRIHFRTTLKKEWVTQEPLFGAQEISLAAEAFGEEYSLLDLTGGIYKASALAARDRADEIAGLYIQSAGPLIERLSPSYAAIADKNYIRTYGREILAAKWKFVYWFNYFGPGYVEKLGKEFLLGIPGYRVEPFASGIWCQLTEKFSQFKDKALREQVRNYLRAKGHGRVSVSSWGEGSTGY